MKTETHQGRGARFREWWWHFGFEPTSPTNLGFCRFLFFGGVLAIYLRKDSSGWAELTDGLWMPISLFHRLQLPVLPADLLSALDLVWKIALAASCLGLLTRVSTLVSFVVGIYLLGLPHNFGKTNHSDALLVLIMLTMAISHSGHAWSLDSLIRRRKAGRLREPSAEYTWPIRFIWVLMVLVFFGAGVSKLRHSGLEWVLPENMVYTLIRHHYSHNPPTSLGLYLAESRWFCFMMAIGTIATEVAAPLALFSRRLRIFLVLSLLLMQLGIWILLGVLFLPFFVCYPLWIPWDRVGQRLSIRGRPRSRDAYQADIKRGRGRVDA